MQLRCRPPPACNRRNALLQLASKGAMHQTAAAGAGGAELVAAQRVHPASIPDASEAWGAALAAAVCAADPGVR